MKSVCFSFLGIFIQLIFISQTNGQQTTDSSLYNTAVSNLHQTYLKEIRDNAQIYHGSEFIRNGQKAIGFPFYESNDMLSGSVSYQGDLYSNQNLYYNLVSDELITNNFAHNALIILATEKVDSFKIGNHVFIPIIANHTNGLDKEGYYDLLFSGEPGVYARREKRLVVGSGSEETKYIQYNNYFIRFKNVYYAVDGKSSLLDVLKDAKDALKKYIRTNKLDFKKDLESSLVISAIYYSQLKH